MATAACLNCIYTADTAHGQGAGQVRPLPPLQTVQHSPDRDTDMYIHREWQERTQKLWRQAPAIRKLPEVLRKYGIEVNPAPFEKLAKYVEEREEYMWASLRSYLEGERRNECYLRTSVAESHEVFHFHCLNRDGTKGAGLLTDVAKALYKALPQTQRQWLEQNGESLLIGFELADVGVVNGRAHIRTSDGFNVLLYVLTKYATKKKLRSFYLPVLTLTRKGARPMYEVYAEPTLAVPKKTLYRLAKDGESLPSQIAEAFKNPAAWLGLLLGDGVVWPKAVGISTDVPELVKLLIPYTAGLNKRAVVLRRFVVDLTVRHAEPIVSMLDALVDAFRDSAPTELKWARLRKLAARRIDAKTALELFKNGLYGLLGEVRRKDEDFVVFRRVEEDAVVYTYLVKIGEKWYATQARFKYRRGSWTANIFTKEVNILEKIKTKLKLENNIRQRKDGRYRLDLYGTAMI